MTLLCRILSRFKAQDVILSLFPYKNDSLKYFYSKTDEIRLFFKFILFCSSTLRVSDGLSLHHKEFKTVHTASITYMSNRFC
jgi:hypothetical protein